VQKELRPLFTPELPSDKKINGILV